MKLSEATRDVHVWIAKDIFFFADECRKYKQIADEKEYNNFFKYKLGIISNCFHGKADVNLPYITLAASKLKREKTTKEHVNSRGRRARQILSRVVKNPDVSFDRIVAYVVDSCKVVISTRKENMRLEKRRKNHLKSGNKTIPWRLMYKLENAKVIQRDLNDYRKYYYIIEGKRFDSAATAAEEYNLDTSQVDTRALNKNSYLDWGKYSIETNTQVFRKVYSQEKKPRKENKDSQKYVYIIEDVVYSNLQEVLQKYDISYSTLVSRCVAKTIWTGWKRIEKEKV